MSRLLATLLLEAGSGISSTVGIPVLILFWWLLLEGV